MLVFPTRGRERAQARKVTHGLQGRQSSPQKIERDALLPCVDSLGGVMPDAIANFDLILGDPDRFEGKLAPDEAVLVENLDRMEGRFDPFMNDSAWGTQESQIARMRFSALGHDFCVRIPSEAIETLGFTAVVPERRNGE